MLNYPFIIPNKKRVSYQLFAYGVILFNIVGYFLQRQETSFTNIFSVILLLLVIGAADWYSYRKRQKLLSLSLLILVPGVLWISAGFYPLFFLNLILWGLYLIARRKLEINVTPDHVSYPSFPTRIINWEDISNLILKDDILTIDLKNNKIYQHQIIYTDQPVNEIEFNLFCKTKISDTNSQ